MNPSSLAEATELQEGPRESDNTSPSETKLLSPMLKRFTSYALKATLIFIPIFFGATHEVTYKSFEALFFVLAAAFCLFERRAASSMFAKGTISLTLIFLLGATLVYTAFFAAVSSFVNFRHPVLGTTGLIVDKEAFFSHLAFGMFFLSVFFTARTYLGSERKRAENIQWTIVFSGFIVSLVALSHWFYDNGRLFWTFEPEFIMVSDRARWPFINPNHLAHFLLLPTFLLFGHLYSRGGSLIESLSGFYRSIRNPISAFLSRRANQEAISKFSLMFVTLAIMLTGIVASLSRGGWLGLATGFLFFAVGDWIISRKEPSEIQPSDLLIREMEGGRTKKERKPHRRRHRSQGKREKSFDLPKMLLLAGRPLLLCISGVLLFYFLKGRGSELLENRLEYGLLYSRDDLRWTLYANTWPMIKENLLFGIGAGGWAQYFFAYMSPEIAGINPVYLHNDPLQYLAENGLVGSIPVFLLAVIIVYRVGKALLNRAFSYKSEVLGIFCSLAAVVTASFLDFPFRIPAIGFFLAIHLALLAFYIDKPFHKLR